MGYLNLDDKETRIYVQTSMDIFSLRSSVKAMGGELEIIARFPDEPGTISNFSELGSSASTR